jgi:hypothetical protein
LDFFQLLLVVLAQTTVTVMVHAENQIPVSATETGLDPIVRQDLAHTDTRLLIPLLVILMVILNFYQVVLLTLEVTLKLLKLIMLLVVFLNCIHGLTVMQEVTKLLHGTKRIFTENAQIKESATEELVFADVSQVTKVKDVFVCLAQTNVLDTACAELSKILAYRLQKHIPLGI